MISLHLETRNRNVVILTKFSSLVALEIEYFQCSQRRNFHQNDAISVSTFEHDAIKLDLQKSPRRCCKLPDALDRRFQFWRSPARANRQLKMNECFSSPPMLTHWGRVTSICVSKLTIIGSDNGLSHDRRQSIIWTNAGFLLIGPIVTNVSEILIEILTFSFKKMGLKASSAKRRPFCLSLNVSMGRGLFW